MGVIVRLQIRQVFAQKKLAFLIVFLLLPVLLSAAVGFAGDLDSGSKDTAGVLFLFLLYPQCFCLLLALLYGSGLLSSELEAKTLTYLFTRPIPKWRFIVGKYVAIVLCVSIPAMASLAISWSLLRMPGGPRFLAGLEAGVFASVVSYTALFAALGTVFPRRSMVVGFLYGGIETMLSFIPALVGKMTVTHFLRSLVVGIADPSLTYPTFRAFGGSPLPTAVLTLIGMSAGAIAVASVLATRREYSLAEQI